MEAHAYFFFLPQVIPILLRVLQPQVASIFVPPPKKKKKEAHASAWPFSPLHNPPFAFQRNLHPSLHTNGRQSPGHDFSCSQPTQQLGPPHLHVCGSVKTHSSRSISMDCEEHASNNHSTFRSFSNSHPLTLLNISDHYTRTVIQKTEPGPVHGRR